jgi:hypothetical protein
MPNVPRHSRRSRGHKLPGWEQVNVAQLARQLEMNPTHLRNLLTGRKTGRVVTYQKLCRALGLNWGTLWQRIRDAQDADLISMRNRAARIAARLEETRHLNRLSGKE